MCKFKQYSIMKVKLNYLKVQKFEDNYATLKHAGTFHISVLSLFECFSIHKVVHFKFFTFSIF